MLHISQVWMISLQAPSFSGAGTFFSAFWRFWRCGKSRAVCAAACCVASSGGKWIYESPPQLLQNSQCHFSQCVSSSFRKTQEMLQLLQTCATYGVFLILLETWSKTRSSHFRLFQNLLKAPWFCQVDLGYRLVVLHETPDATMLARCKIQRWKDAKVQRCQTSWCWMHLLDEFTTPWKCLEMIWLIIFLLVVLGRGSMSKCSQNTSIA